MESETDPKVTSSDDSGEIQLAVTNTLKLLSCAMTGDAASATIAAIPKTMCFSLSIGWPPRADHTTGPGRFEPANCAATSSGPRPDRGRRVTNPGSRPGAHRVEWRVPELS